MTKINSFSAAIVIALAALLVFVWRQILFFDPATKPKLFFLDVGQGDATLLVLPGNVKIITDAGPDRKIIGSLGNVLEKGDRYIDLAIISHPQLDHYNGFNYLLDNYEFGAFIFSGRSNDAEEWKILIDTINAKNVPLVALGAGDRVRYKNNSIDIISPGRALLQSAELNDTGLVELVSAPPLKALLAADIGFGVEKQLVANSYQIAADILKVPHHGSKYSSGLEFIGAVQPKLAVIGVGRNRYGHPTEEAVSRLSAYTEKIFRTDRNGTVEVVAEGDKLLVFTEKQ